jgi:membrane peptidoglycan carboxypeptidase
MRKRDHNVLASGLSLLVCGLLAGIVVAAAFFPGMAMSGLAAKAGAEAFDELPAELSVRSAPQISYVYANDGETLLTTMYDENRRDSSLDDVPQVMRDAIIAAEDHKFYEHNGVDIQGIARAFVANTANDATTQGASTLTMQMVRLAASYFAETPQEVLDATEQTTGRKLLEARRAMAVEKRLTKDQILENYLNMAFFGHGAFGVYAASQVYFGKAPKDLELSEAALLAGLVQSPSEYNPATEEGVPLATERRNYVLDQMVITGAITPAEAAEAKAVEVEVEGERTRNGCVATTKNNWGFFCDFFYRWWLDQETFGATPYERERRLKGGGYHIVTTLDPKVQKAAKENVEQYLETGNPHALMVAAVEPGSGKVRAMAVNRNYRLDDPDDPKNKPHTDPRKRAQGLRGTYPNTTNPLISGGGDITGYQAGSTFKIFAVVAGLEEGLPLDYNRRSPGRYTTRFPVEAGGAASCGTRWCPANANGPYMNGVRNMWSGFGRSVNTYFAQLMEAAGPENVVDAANRMGIRFRAGEDAALADNAEQWGSFVLGVSGTTPLDLANAYATVASGGKYCEPIPVQEIRTLEGESLDVADPRCRRVIDEDVALAAADAAKCPVGGQSHYGRCQPPGTFAQGTGIVGKPIIGKTGTSDGNRTASLVLSTRQLTVAGIMADPDWAETDKEMVGVGVNHDAVAETLRDAMKGVEAKDWPRPDSNKLVWGDQVGVPDVRCRPVEEARSILQNAGFRVEVDDQQIDSNCPRGEAAGTNPSGRTVRNGVVVITVSNGSDAPDEDDADDGGGGPGGGGPGNGNGGPGGGGEGDG